MRWRFTVDLRPINQYTVRQHGPLPVIGHELPLLAGSEVYVNLDMNHGY